MTQPIQTQDRMNVHSEGEQHMNGEELKGAIHMNSAAFNPIAPMSPPHSDEQPSEVDEEETEQGQTR